MHALYRMKAEELTEDFLVGVEMLFKGKTIEITLCEFLEQSEESQDRRSLKNWAGALKDSPAFAGDPLEQQRRLRDE